MLKHKLNTSFRLPEPQSFSELKLRLDTINGQTIAALAAAAGLEIPSAMVHAKGFAGQLIELHLGACAGSRPIPDFPALGLELKTLPVDEKLQPLESTFLCHAPLTGVRSLTFEQTTLFNKIRSILFVLLQGSRAIALPDRHVLGYFHFIPSAEELQTIRDDWSELMEMVSLGEVNSITARIGTIIQMRPKAASGRNLTCCTGPDGRMIKTRPRGFYLRREFTAALCRRCSGS